MLLRLLAALVIPFAASACSCGSSGPPCQAAGKASAIFLGTVAEKTNVSQDPDTPGASSINAFIRTKVTFEVQEPFLGMDGRSKRVEVRTGSGGGDCGYVFTLGQQYIIYANENGGLLLTSICSRTAPVEKAEADLKFLRSMKAGLPSFVFGVVTDGRAATSYNRELGMYASDGIAGAKVTLSGAVTASVVTENSGAFRFDKLQPGKYSLVVSKDGYAVQGSQRELDLHPNGCVYALQRLVVDRRIRGKVISSEGLPAAGIHVEIVPTRPTENAPFPMASITADTDNDGMYELRNIPAGEYYLGVNLIETPSKAVPYGRCFYPGTEDPSNAGLITFREAPELKSYDFQIPPLQHELAIIGSVNGLDGRPAEGVYIQLEDLHFPWQNNVIASRTDAAGHFAILVFDGTEYCLHANHYNPLTNSYVSSEPTPLTSKSKLTVPLRLILTQKGSSTARLWNKGLERWKAGLGF